GRAPAGIGLDQNLVRAAVVAVIPKVATADGTANRRHRAPSFQKESISCDCRFYQTARAANLLAGKVQVDAAGNGAGGAELELGVDAQLKFLRIGDEGDFDKDGRHRRVLDDDERLVVFDAAVEQANAFAHRALHGPRQFRRAGVAVVPVNLGAVFA